MSKRVFATVGGVLIAASAMMATPALAEGLAIRASHDAIAQRDWATAERLLLAEQRIFPKRTEVLLNLAAVYANTGRMAQANDLYRRVLASDDVLMDLSADRTATAHAIATTGLQRLAPVQTAAR